jgi:replicative superfamily II helicase
MQIKREIIVALMGIGTILLIGLCAGQTYSGVTDLQAQEISDDIQPYQGSIGAGSALYGLKIAMENLDETFTFNATERLEKQIAHADQRIAEVKAAFQDNQTSGAERALELYSEKLNKTESELKADNYAGRGLWQAEQVMAKHQLALESLIQSHPDRAGLLRAYNSSRILEDRFSERTAITLTRLGASDHHVLIQPVMVQRENRTENMSRTGEEGPGPHH